LCMPVAVSPLQLDDADALKVRQWLSAFGTPQQVALRCRIVLAAAEGESDNAIAQRLQINRKTGPVARPLHAGRSEKPVGDCSWPGRKPTYGPEKIQEIVETTLRAKPKGRTQWSCRSLAAGKESANRRSAISGGATILSRIASKPSSSRATRTFWRS